LLAAMAGCTADDIVQTGGTLPDETPMNTWNGQLCSGRTLSRLIDIDLYEEDEENTESISYTLTKPTASTITLKAIADETLAVTYNKLYNLESKIFPSDNVRFDNEGTLTIAAGEQASAPIKMHISTLNLDTETLYLLALTIKKTSANAEAQTEKQALYYRIYIEKIATYIQPWYGVDPENIPELLPNLTGVFYVNTETYQPFIANNQTINAKPKGQSKVIYSLGKIINLKRATINYDATSGRVIFTLGTDLSYVLEHSNKYLRPIQVHDRKICLCIENGGQGIGFCNMNATQITDFVRQVKAVVERYNLDGINLWDEDSQYNKTGMPEKNTTSYPTLIKKLREAMPDKLLTLVDKGDATEYFHDIDKCGGIEVGRYLDYAWHGYCSPKEHLQIINPNFNGSQTYSQYTRKPIAGLDEKKYGSVNIPLYNDHDIALRNQASETMVQWKTLNNKKSDVLVWGSDLIYQEYGGYEGSARAQLFDYGVPNFMDDGNTWIFEEEGYSIPGNTRYSPGDAFYYGSPDTHPFRKDW